MDESLDRLPDVARDQYGNLGFKGENAGHSGLRPRVNWVLALPDSALTGTVLCELLDWLRWGSQVSVMWECSLPELILVIEKWLAANPGAPVAAFHPHFRQDVDWEKLWTERGFKDGMRVKHRCGCGRLYGDFTLICKKCWQQWHEMERVNVGPRGPGTYNLVLQGADGGSVAAAVWTNRNWVFWSPLEFERKNDLYAPVHSPNHSILDA